ncbi:MAG: pyridoxal-dependent decarboxylase, exosortase A system-associated [Proteobacteria bacterium]|nr:MAG: pyridoxal-dependent decarboxylase, exosortase A system-associated [Pseudomonadota bacterium]
MKLDGFDFARLAAQHETPFYLYDMDQAIAHLNTLREHLPENLHVMYCMKANANKAVLAAYRDNTPFLDISSAGEMEMAFAIGYEGEVMSFAGPGKDDIELRRAVEGKVRTISLESAAELSRLTAICRELNVKQGVTVRINPADVPKAFMMKMGGRPSQFGVPEEEASEVLGQALAAPELQVRGVHIFSGTQCLDAESVVANIEQTLAIAKRLAEKHDMTLEMVNLGGGLGIPYFPGQEAMDVSGLSCDIGGLVSRFTKENGERFSETQFFLELGRFLIGLFGVYIAKVIEIKETRGKRFVIMDGGMHHCFPATGNFGQLVKKNYPIENISADAQRERGKFELVGPLCTPLDSMARGLELPEAEPGDLICFQNSGAYSYAASPLLFLGHDTPAELVHYKGQLTLARPRRSGKSFM